MFKILLIILCLVFGSRNSQAEPVEFKISGYGAKVCLEVLKSFDGKGGVNFRKLQYISWVHGFVTSYSYHKNILIHTDWNYALPFIGLYCKKYKNQTLLDASIQYVAHLIKEQK
jgi:hypothetical protein